MKTKTDKTPYNHDFQDDTCEHCGEKATRKLYNKTLLCDTMQCMMEEISRQTDLTYGNDEEVEK